MFKLDITYQETGFVSFAISQRIQGVNDQLSCFEFDLSEIEEAQHSFDFLKEELKTLIEFKEKLNCLTS